jgi:hypothetical protein
MKKIKYGIVAGLVFAIVDIIPMLFIEMPDRRMAFIGAFINRFAYRNSSKFA